MKPLIKETTSSFNSSMTSPYLHTPGITNGIRPGLGGQHHYCDCSAANKLSTHFVTVLVSVQYLSLLCMKYCAVLSGLKQWRPEYMPSSTPPSTTISPVTTPPTTTTMVAVATTATTTIIESLQRLQEEDEQNFSTASTNDFRSTYVHYPA